MQSLNLVENAHVDFNAFKIFDTRDHNDNYRKLALIEQLQTTLALDSILNIFAMEISKYIDFSGLYFKSSTFRAEARGSKLAKKERCFELKVNKQYIGTLTYAINSPISLSNNKIIKELHQLLIHPINNAMKYQQAMLLAMQDSLTNLGNRRYFDEQLKRAMHHANRQGTVVGLMMCDLNKFKAINDTFGHHIGDKVLIQFAQALTSSVRDSDTVFRFGGDEFAILVEDTDIASLSAIDVRIKRSLEQNAVLHKYQVSCSTGYTLMTRADNEHSFFTRADGLLYQQKFNQIENKLNLV